MAGNYWDDEAYIRIVDAAYNKDHDCLTVRFADGDTVSIATWRLLRSTARAPDWEHLRVVDNYHITVPVAAGTGDLGSDETDIPGMAIRSITDPIFAAHLARHAEESARRVGERLQALRKARGFTTQHVAERVGMAQQNVSRIEQGRHAVSYPTLEKILAAMGYTLADLLPLPDSAATTMPEHGERAHASTGGSD